MFMQFIIVSESDAKKIVEAQLLKKVRQQSVSNSLEESRRLFESARRENDLANRLYHEALLALAEDEDDDFATALEKRQKFEQIEDDFVVAGRRYEKALSRLGWELQEAEKVVGE
jgi:hypothetical protein